MADRNRRGNNHRLGGGGGGGRHGRHNHQNHGNGQNVVSGESGTSDDAISGASDSSDDDYDDFIDHDNNGAHIGDEEEEDIFDVGSYGMDDAGELGGGDQEEENDEDHEEDDDETGNPNQQHQGHPFLYDSNLDDEDEAWVYQNRRGGVKEAVNFVQRGPHHEQDDEYPPAEQKQQEEENEDTMMVSRLQKQKQQNKNKKKKKTTTPVYKPRSSDAVLSCPCCFNIVCMDCQRHSFYPNQFRAMFVMGIVVDWNKRFLYNEQLEGLVPTNRHNSKSSSSSIEELGDNDDDDEEEDTPTTLVVEDDHLHHHDNHPDVCDDINNVGSEISLNHRQTNSSRIPKKSVKGKGEYFATLCANCETQVAVLDMSDEVYHFHGCLESAAPS